MYNRSRLLTVLFSLIVLLLINLNSQLNSNSSMTVLTFFKCFRSLTFVQNIRVGEILYSNSIEFYVYCITSFRLINTISALLTLSVRGRLTGGI